MISRWSCNQIVRFRLIGVEYQDALEQDEEVDLWADFGGSDP